MFKIFEEIDYVDPSTLFTLVSKNYRTLEHKYKFRQGRSCLQPRQFFFSNRVVGLWNGLSLDVVEVVNLSKFKRKLHRHMNDKGWLYIFFIVLVQLREWDS